MQRGTANCAGKTSTGSGGGGGGRGTDVATEAGGKRSAGDWDGAWARKGCAESEGLGTPNPGRGPLGGSQAPGDPAGSSCQSDNPGPPQPPAPLEDGEAAGGAGRERGVGKGRRPGRPRPLRCHWAAAAASAPPFLHPTRLVRGLVWPGPLTSPPSLLPWAPHVWRRRRPGRQRGSACEHSGRGR